MAFGRVMKIYASGHSRVEDSLTELKAIADEMLAGRLPFPQQANAWAYVSCHMHEEPLPVAEAEPELAELPAQLHELLHRLLKKKPEERPRSAGFVVAALDEIVDQLAASTPTGRWLFGLIGKRR